MQDEELGPRLKLATKQQLVEELTGRKDTPAIVIYRILTVNVLIDDDGAELVTVNPWVYKRLTSKAGQANVFNLDHAVEDGVGEAE